MSDEDFEKAAGVPSAEGGEDDSEGLIDSLFPSLPKNAEPPATTPVAEPPVTPAPVSTSVVPQSGAGSQPADGGAPGPQASGAPAQAQPPAAGETPASAPIPITPPETVQAPVSREEQRQLAAKEFSEAITFSEEDQNAFMPEQLDTLKKLSGELHTRTFEAVYMAVVSQLPQLLEFVQNLKASERANEEKFFQSFPELKDHTPMVVEAFQNYRAAFPKATAEQAMSAVGNMVRAQLGLTAVAPAAPAAPAKPVVRPFQPAAPAPPVAQGGAPAVNPFAALAAQWQED